MKLLILLLCLLTLACSAPKSGIVIGPGGAYQAYSWPGHIMLIGPNGQSYHYYSFGLED